MRIGEVARASGVHVQTLRFYEREKLLRAPRRRASGYRDYAEDAVAVVLFIKRMQEVGFTLKEIGDLLRLRENRRADCDHVRSLTEKKLLAIDEKIGRLEAMKGALISLVASCEGTGTLSCPLVEVIAATR